MAYKVLVYNNANKRIEKYFLNANDTMPYATKGSLTVDEFRGSSTTSILWTDRRLMECWSALREAWGQRIVVWFAFKRIWEGGHSFQSQHYAGMAIDMAQGLQNPELQNLRNLASNLGCFTYVEPASLAPTWVHVDTRMLPAACQFGYPQVQKGSINTYVLTLQDALNAVGFTTKTLDGIFGKDTESAVKAFQRYQNLPADGIVGCTTWTTLTQKAKGIGKTATVIDA